MPLLSPQASRMVFDARVSDWGLSHVRRHDMHQADIAPLMAALLNTPVPVNNVVGASRGKPLIHPILVKIQYLDTFIQLATLLQFTSWKFGEVMEKKSRFSNMPNTLDKDSVVANLS